MQPADHLSLVLVFAALSLFLGALGGAGGRLAALWALRRELAALAAGVDPTLPSKVASLAESVRAFASTIEGCVRETKTLSGRMSADERRAQKLAPGDLEFITAHVIARLQAQARGPQSVPPPSSASRP